MSPSFITELRERKRQRSSTYYSTKCRAYSLLRCILYIYYTTTWLHEHTTTLRRTYWLAIL